MNRIRILRSVIRSEATLRILISPSLILFPTLSRSNHFQAWIKVSLKCWIVTFFPPPLRVPLLQTCTLRWPKLEICRPFMSAHLTTFSVKFLFFFFKVQAALITIHRKCHNNFSRPGSPAERSPRFSGVFNLRDLMVGMQAIALKIFVLPRWGGKKNMAAQRCQYCILLHHSCST